ncbi:MAG: CAAX amino terminal protease self- immunity [Firmicutes bacterium ADurb.Bin419]|nr:MAG: CAAX amino terminal protease self- immunity [Firmicutes bacterium ADurb.Bin419]
MNKYIKSPALILLYLFIYFGVQIFVTMIFTVVKTFEYVASHSGNLTITVETLTAVQNDVLQNTNLILLISILISLPLYTLASKITKENFSSICSFKKISIRNLILSLTTGVSLAVFIILFLSYIDTIFPLDKLPGDYDGLIQQIMGGNYVITFLAIGILGPIMEEIIFRGFILKELRKIMPVAAAVIVQALLFGLIHLNILQSSYAFVIGLVLGIAFVATKTLYAPIIIHLSFNTLNVILSKTTLSSQLEKYSFILLIASFLISLSSIIIQIKQKNINGIE